MSKLPSTGPSLQRYLRQQARTAQRQQQSSAFNLSGTSVVAENVTEVDGTLNVVGNLNVSGPAVITGTLSLPAGIIDNAALASPVKPQAVYIEAQNFALSHTSAGTFVSSTVTVPAGFTSAVVSVVGRLFAINPNTGADYLSAVTKIDGTGGVSIPLLVGPSGGSGINVSPFSRVLTGLTPGGTFVLALMGNTNVADWAANAANIAEVSGSIHWFR